jgi:hypothetical protein
MTINGSRLKWATLPIILLVALVAAACGTSTTSESSELAALETGACANQAGGTLVLAHITDGPEHDFTVAYITEYLAEFGFGYTTQVKAMTLAEAATGIGDCSVHVVSGAPAGWSASGATDFGVLYVDSVGPVHKFAVAQLTALTPDFAAALGRMDIPLRRVEATTEWYNSEKRPWLRETDDPRWAPQEPWKAAVSYYWEFDFNDGSWKDWMGGEFAPFDQIRKVTQAVTREIRGTPYKGEDQYEGRGQMIEYDDDLNILLDSRTMVTSDGELSLR